MSSSPERPTRIDAGDGAVAYLVESHEIPLVDMSISFRTGSAFDPDAKLGLARIFARMLRRGAEGWTSDRIEETVDRYGSEIGVDASASTITVHAQVIRRNLEPFMQLLTAIVAKPTFPEDELARLQREAVAEIIEARDSDRSLAGAFFRKSLFGPHPYGRRSTTKTIPAITRDDVVAFHAKHAVRGNVVLGISGDISEAEVRALILPLVAALPKGNAPADPTPEPNPIRGRKLLLVDKPARSQTQILVGGLGTKPEDADHFALHVANTVFGGTFTARLMNEVRSKRGWSYGAYSRLPIDRRREAFSLWTFPSATDAAACVALELELLEALVKDGITQQELEFAQGYLSESYAFDVDTAYKRVRQAVDEELYGLPGDYHTRYVEQVRAVTLAEANASLRSRIPIDDLVIVVVGTASQIQEPIQKAIPRLAAAAVVPFDQE
jgi:zinc protease